MQHVLATDVDDEDHGRPQRGDVGEVLVGTDAEVHAAGLHSVLESRDDRLVLHLVRDEVARRKVAARLGELRDHPPEVAVLEPGRNAAGVGQGHDERHDDWQDGETQSLHELDRTLILDVWAA